MFTIYHIWIECTVAEAVWQEMKEIWEFLSIIKSRIPVFIDELIVFMALCPVHAAAQSGGRRWEITYQTAVWIIWKAYLSHFFDQSHNYWTSEASLGLYRELIKSRVLTDRTVSMKKTLQNKQYNSKQFKLLWGEWFNEVRIVKGLRCLFRSFRLSVTPLQSEEFFLKDISEELLSDS